MKLNNSSVYDGDFQPLPFHLLTKIDGPLNRHVEQLWDEIQKLKERINKLESHVKEL